MNTMMWSPLFLRGHVGPFNAAGGSGYPADLSINPRLLMNPNRTAMLVDQFKFTLDVNGDQGIQWGANACRLACELKLGSIPLTNGPVTVGVLAPLFAGNASTVSITMHLHKPMYVPSGVQLNARFVRQPIFSPGKTDADDIANICFGVVGRSLPEDHPVPSKIWVPWVTEAKAGPCNVSRYVTKDGTGLHNPHTEPLHVKSFIGVNTVPDVSQFGVGTTLAPLTVQMTASNNLAVIRDPTPFFLLFPDDRRLLSANALLQPGQFIRTEYEIVLLTGQAASYIDIEFTSIGMHGYRQIDTPKGT